jgi:hypothetical protein
MSKKTWLRNENPTYASALADRELVRAFYTGEGVGAYLRQYAQGESPTAFEERKALAHADPHLALVVDTVAGMLFDAEADRSFGALGDPEVPGTTAHAFWRDADGAGTTYRAALQQAAVELVLMNEVWVLVDPDEDGRPRVKILPTLSVTDWVEDRDGIAEALTVETVDGRRSVLEDPALQTQYAVYGPSEWTRYREDDGQVVFLGSGAYSETNRPYLTRSGRPTAPVVRVRLPFRRYVAAQLARSGRALFSKRSDRDALQRSASYPKLVLTATDDEFTEILDGIRAGSNVLRLDPQHAGTHDYIAPPMDGVLAATETLAADERAFYQTAWRLLESEGQAAVTATEAVLNRSAGLSAALTLVAAAMEELERSVLYLAEQAVTDRPGDWTSDATWPTNYNEVKMDLPGMAQGGPDEAQDEA